VRYGKCGKTKTQKRNIQKRRAAKKIYSKKTIWIIRQEVSPRILGKTREKLKIVERKMIRRKKNRNDCRGRRKRERKIRS